MRRDAHARPVAERAAVAAPVAPDLAALVAHYQRELRLLDWRLDVSYAPDLADSRGRPVWGLCYPTVDAKVATIVIRDPATPPDGATAEQAVKQVVETVVHELLHLHFAAFGTSSPAEIAHEEQVVWALAEALIKAKGTPDEAMYARAALVAIDRSTAKVRAAKAQEKENMLDPKLALEGLKIITAKDAKGALELLNRLLASALGGEAEAEEPAAEEPAAEEPAAEPMPAARVVVAPGEDALAALGRAALALTGVSDPGEAIAEMARRSALAVGVEEREAAVARDRAVLELTERKALVASLVKVGAETPATSGLATGTLVPRLMGEPIAELRARVAAMTAARPVARVVPPTDDAADGLTPAERAKCKAKGIDPNVYLATRAGIRARNAGAAQ
ncbi:MAG: hypothetical protein IPQ09_26100 [Myxococcales bacterium]|nr:hypothetical protein [Myxococcales bacterium]